MHYISSALYQGVKGEKAYGHLDQEDGKELEERVMVEEDYDEGYEQSLVCE